MKTIITAFLFYLPILVVGQSQRSDLSNIGTGESHSLNQRHLEKGFLAYMNSDYDQAFKILDNSTSSGNHEVYYALGKMYENGQGVIRNPSRAFSRFEQAAKLGNVKAQYLSGMYLYEGKGVTKDLDRSIDWLSQAAENNHPLASDQLSQVKNDKRMAGLEEEKESQSQTDSKILSTRENIAEGDRLYDQKDYSDALEYYLLAAEKGNAYAQERVGWLYYNGQGKVAKDKDEAIRWWKKAAGQGNTDAINYLTRLGEW